MKININKALEIYEEEMAWKAELEKEFNPETESATSNTQPNTDPLWNTWYEWSTLYEPENDKDMEEVQETETVDDFQDVTPDIFGMTDDSEPVKYNRRTRRAKRRKNTVRHKQRLCNKVKDMINGYVKRSYEDQMNWSFCKKRGGHRVEDPKSCTMKVDKIYKKAQKMKLVKEEQNTSNTAEMVA